MALVCNTRLIIETKPNMVSFYIRNENHPLTDETGQKTAAEGPTLPKGSIGQSCWPPQREPQQGFAGYRGPDGCSGRSHHPDCHIKGSGRRQDGHPFDAGSDCASQTRTARIFELPPLKTADDAAEAMASIVGGVPMGN